MKESLILNKSDSYTHRIKIDNLDISYFNQFLFHNTESNLSLRGGISTDCIINADNNEYSFSGTIETNNLNIFILSPDPYSIVSNENININTEFKVNTDSGAFTIKEFKIFDDYLSINGSAEYINNKITTFF